MKLAVDLKSSFHLIAVLLQWIGVTFIIPLIVALLYVEPIWPWIISGVITSALGTFLRHLTEDSADLTLREAFLVVGLSWLIIALLGTMPYLLLGVLSPINAFFESMSGFTTTGATVMLDIESQLRSLLFYRSFSQWLGGMGIIVLAIAVLPKLAIGGRQLMEAEIPGGEVERLTPRIRETAKTLWWLYVGMTVAETAALSAAGLSLYDAVLHALTTLPTGGFSPKQESVSAFSPIAQWIVMFFILLAGINFALFYRSLRKQPQKLFQDREFRTYIVLLLIAAGFLLVNTWGEHPNFADTLRHSLFQSLTIMTGTGYASTDFDNWNAYAHFLILALMFIGGSAGSTTGSIKVLRWLLVGKMLMREIRHILHPRAVIPVRIGDRVVNDEALRGAAIYILLFIAIFVFGTLMLLLNFEWAGGVVDNGVRRELTALEAMSAVAATLGNVGPGLGVFGPMESYEPIPKLSKILLSLLMWIGRLEIFPILVLFSIGFWRR